MNTKWENPRCNFCGNKRSIVVWDNISTWIVSGTYRIVSCKNCDLVYLSPRPKMKYILEYYPPETYWGTGVVGSNNKEGKIKRDGTYGYLYEKIINKKEKGAVLDLGAGTGLFLSRFKELGWETLGVELSKKACLYARRSYGLKLITGSFPEVKLPVRKYDVITLNGCLEHLYKPKESLVKIYKLLKDDGLVEITVPNFDSLGRITFGKNWYALQPPSHLYHFTPHTITNVLTKIGFRDIEIRYNYWEHNLYILFESIRLLFSPRFKGKNIIDFSKTTPISTNKGKVYKMVFGKAFARTISFVFALIEPVIRRGEVMTIYAKKN